MSTIGSVGTLGAPSRRFNVGGQLIKVDSIQVGFPGTHDMYVGETKRLATMF
jgi:hypothetical protein